MRGVARAATFTARRVVGPCYGLASVLGSAEPFCGPLADAAAGGRALTVVALSPQMPVAVGPYGQSQPSCFDRVKMGFVMGCAVGMAAGALFGTFSCLR